MPSRGTFDQFGSANGSLTYSIPVDTIVAAIIAWVRRHRFLVLGCLLGTTLLSLEGVRRLSFDSDVLSLLPRDRSVFQSFRVFLERFRTLDQLYVVFTAPEDHAISEYSDDIDGWVTRLRAVPEIARVDAGFFEHARDFGWLAEHQLLLLHGGLLDEALRRLSVDGMPGAVSARKDLLTLPSPEVVELVRQDPTGLLDLLRRALGEGQTGINLRVGKEGYVTPDGRSRLVIAKPNRPPFDATFSQALDERLQEIERSFARPIDRIDNGNEALLPPMQVQFAGGHRVAVETERVIRRESIMNTVGSLCLILPLLFVVFRSSWLITVGALPSALSILFTLGALGFAGVKLSAAATGGAAMLFGLGVDGVVLLYVAHQLATSSSANGSEVEGIVGPSSSMLLGMWTTAATFYGLMFVDFPSLQELGRLLGHSMMVCGLLTLVVVPALLPKRALRSAGPFLTMPRLAAWILRWHRTLLSVGFALTCILGIAATRLRVNPTLDRLRSVTEAAQLEQKIAAAFALPTDVYVALANGPQLEPLLEANEQLARQLATEIPDLAFQAPARLLPSARSQAQTAGTIAQAHLSAVSVRASLERARQNQDFRPGAFEPFSARIPSLLDPEQRLSYEGYINHGLIDLIDRFIVQENNRWTLATYMFPTNPEQTDRIESILNDNASHTLTGLSLVNRELARSFVPQFIKGLAIGTVVVAALVGLAFREWRLSVYALLPTAIGLIWAAGALALAGIELDLFSVFAVVTFVGIGVDYGVHLVHRSNERGDATRATAELAPVILVAATITMMGYGTLITSSYPPLRSIGVVSVACTFALAAASLLVLPALLMTANRRAVCTVDRTSSAS